MEERRARASNSHNFLTLKGNLATGGDYQKASAGRSFQGLSHKKPLHPLLPEEEMRPRVVVK